MLEIWREEKEQGRTGTSAKVRNAPAETGARWAEEQIREGRIDCEKAVTNLDPKKFPKGYLEKIEGLGPRAAVKSLLRDARNHGLAFRESGADRNLGSPADEYFLEILPKALLLQSTRSCSILSRFRGRIKLLKGSILCSIESVAP